MGAMRGGGVVNAWRWCGSAEEDARWSRSRRRLLGGALMPGEPAGEDGKGRALHPEELACAKVWGLTAKSHGGRGVWHSAWWGLIISFHSHILSPPTSQVTALLGDQDRGNCGAATPHGSSESFVPLLHQRPSVYLRTSTSSFKHQCGVCLHM